MAAARPFGPAQVARHAEMLGNRVRKNFRRLEGGFRKENTTAFRLYDWDIPEVRAFVDWYDGQVVLAELVRTQTDEIPDYAPRLAREVARALDLQPEQVWTRRRQTGAGVRYGVQQDRGHLKIVLEQGLKFRVNLSDYIDTGLFLDHRNTRREFGQRAKGLRVLNLFAYTGAFSVHAARGGARRVTTVDASRRYLDWAKDNFAINRLRPGELVEANVADFLDQARRKKARWDLVLVDPPSFSTRWRTGRFDIQSHHRSLLSEVMDVIEPGGTVYFSTNHQRFEPDLQGLAQSIEEITERTIPVDFKNRQAHRCWVLSV